MAAVVEATGFTGVKVNDPDLGLVARVHNEVSPDSGSSHSPPVARQPLEVQLVLPPQLNLNVFWEFRADPGQLGREVFLNPSSAGSS